MSQLRITAKSCQILHDQGTQEVIRILIPGTIASYHLNIQLLLHDGRMIHNLEYPNLCDLKSIIFTQLFDMHGLEIVVILVSLFRPSAMMPQKPGSSVESQPGQSKPLSSGVLYAQAGPEYTSRYQDCYKDQVGL